jgi:competence protein ComGC
MSCNNAAYKEESSMSKMSQKEAVFQAVTNVVGVQDGAYTLNREQRASVNQILFEGFRSHTVECETEYNDS